MKAPEQLHARPPFGHVNAPGMPHSPQLEEDALPLADAVAAGLVGQLVGE